MRKPQNITTKEKLDQSDEFSKNSWEWLSISSETLVEKEKNSSVFSAANFSVPRFVWPLWPAVTSGGEVPVSDVNKVWNALKCYNLHPDPCWLATRECRKGRWSEVSFGGHTLLMPTPRTMLVGPTIYMHNRILFCRQLSTASLLARPWPLPLADTFSFLEFLGPPSWRGAAVAPYISPSIN